MTTWLRRSRTNERITRGANWLLASCSYRVYPSYYYGYSSEPDSSYSETYTQPNGYNSYGFGSGRQS